MAETSFDSSRSEQPASALISLLDRDDDPVTLRLRSLAALDGVDELVSLRRATSPPSTAPSSSGTRSTALSSSRKESTKPTSAGTSYPVEGYTGKGKATVQPAWSVSATQGSASEAEADLEAAVDRTLFGVGDWMGDDRIPASPLRGAARARRRTRMNRRSEHKKPLIIHHGIAHNGDPEGTSDDDEYPAMAAARPPARYHAREAENLRARRTKPGRDDQPALCEGEEEEEAGPSRQSAMTSPHKPLSRARSYIVTGLVLAMALTLAMASFAAHHTGRARMRCTKGIIFSASVLMSCLTVLTMVVGKQGLHAALLAGLLAFAVGFALVVQIHDFM